MNLCPTCHQPLGGTARFCYACKRPILRTHKWHVEGCVIRHDDCQNPTMRVLIRPTPEQSALSPEETTNAPS
jgi:hypothetical protein